MSMDSRKHTNIVEMDMLEKKFDEELKRYAELSFSECIDHLRHLYSRRDITEDETKHIIDSIWILCQGADNDWTIDFGFGSHIKATKRDKCAE